LHLTVIEPRFIGRLASSLVTSQTLIYGPSCNVYNLGDLQIELRISYVKKCCLILELSDYLFHTSVLSMQCCELPREKLVLIVSKSINTENKQYVPENI